MSEGVGGALKPNPHPLLAAPIEAAEGVTGNARVCGD